MELSVAYHPKFSRSRRLQDGHRIRLVQSAMNKVGPHDQLDRSTLLPTNFILLSALVSLGRSGLHTLRLLRVLLWQRRCGHGAAPPAPLSAENGLSLVPASIVSVHIPAAAIFRVDWVETSVRLYMYL